MADDPNHIIIPPTEEQIAVFFHSMDVSANRINNCVADDAEFLLENHNDAAETKKKARKVLKIVCICKSLRCEIILNKFIMKLNLSIKYSIKITQNQISNLFFYS